MGAMLAVEDVGDGEPLVLIHGLATTRAIWTLVIPALARTRRVITLDVPGFGDSEPVGEDFELEAVADRIARGLEAHGLTGPFDLVGHSLGAGIALTLAAGPAATACARSCWCAGGVRGLSAPRCRASLSGGANRLLAARRALRR